MLIYLLLLLLLLLLFYLFFYFIFFTIIRNNLKDSFSVLIGIEQSELGMPWNGPYDCTPMFIKLEICTGTDHVHMLFLAKVFSAKPNHNLITCLNVSLTIFYYIHKYLSIYTPLVFCFCFFLLSR